MSDRIANIGAGMVPAYHATESVEEAKAVVEQCKTSTGRLRAMLDERGVEWDYGITGATTTRFSVNGIDLTFTPMRDGLVCSTILTPAQAIAVTLGAGTCRMETADDCQNWNSCSECGADYYTDQPINFCPNCGRKVVDK